MSDSVPIVTASIPGSSVFWSAGGHRVEGVVKRWVLIRGQWPFSWSTPVLPGSLLSVCEGAGLERRKRRSWAPPPVCLPCSWQALTLCPVFCCDRCLPVSAHRAPWFITEKQAGGQQGGHFGALLHGVTTAVAAWQELKAFSLPFSGFMWPHLGVLSPPPHVFLGSPVAVLTFTCFS